ncbi:hypothetical protein JCM14713_01360 [Desulfomicrobium salsuginis]
MQRSRGFTFFVTLVSRDSMQVMRSSGCVDCEDGSFGYTPWANMTRGPAERNPWRTIAA